MNSVSLRSRSFSKLCWSSGDTSASANLRSRVQRLSIKENQQLNAPVLSILSRFRSSMANDCHIHFMTLTKNVVTEEKSSRQSQVSAESNTSRRPMHKPSTNDALAPRKLTHDLNLGGKLGIFNTRNQLILGFSSR